MLTEVGPTKKIVRNLKRKIRGLESRLAHLETCNQLTSVPSNPAWMSSLTTANWILEFVRIHHWKDWCGGRTWMIQQSTDGTLMVIFGVGAISLAMKHEFKKKLNLNYTPVEDAFRPINGAVISQLYTNLIGFNLGFRFCQTKQIAVPLESMIPVWKYLKGMHIQLDKQRVNYGKRIRMKPDRSGRKEPRNWRRKKGFNDDHVEFDGYLHEVVNSDSENFITWTDTMILQNLRDCFDDVMPEGSFLKFKDGLVCHT